MTLLEAAPSLPTQEFPGQALSLSREYLAHYLRGSHVSHEGFTSCMTDYVNHFEDMYFNSNRPFFADYESVALVLKNEVQLITGKAIETAYDVTPRLKAYSDDPEAEMLRAYGHSALPRAMTLTLFDLVDEYR